MPNANCARSWVPLSPPAWSGNWSFCNKHSTNMGSKMINVQIELEDVTLVFEQENLMIYNKSCEGMEIGAKELNDMLVQYLKENF
jgi:hypothetical protein